MEALLLIILGGLNTLTPSVELKSFDAFEDCKAAAIEEINNGYYAQCAGRFAHGKIYSKPPPLRRRRYLRVEPKQAKLSESFEFHRPVSDICEAEAFALRAQGQEAACTRAHRGLLAD